MSLWQSNACARWSEPVRPPKRKQKPQNPFEEPDPFIPFEAGSMPRWGVRCLFELTGALAWRAFGHVENQFFAVLYSPEPHRIRVSKIARWCDPKKVEAKE